MDLQVALGALNITRSRVHIKLLVIVVLLLSTALVEAWLQQRCKVSRVEIFP